MTDRPILFSAPMVRALLAGTKVQTRRMLKPQPPEGARYSGVHYASDEPASHFFNSSHGPHKVRAPIEEGDVLWVREAHALLPRTAYRMSIGTGTIAQREHPTDGYTAALFREGFDRSGRPQWRPSIHMPRWASRLTLTVTDVRVQRLQDISEDDAWAEGCAKGVPDDVGGFFPAEEPHPSGKGWTGWDNARDWYADLWDRINGEDAWAANPCVVAYGFTVERRNIDSEA